MFAIHHRCSLDLDIHASRVNFYAALKVLAKIPLPSRAAGPYVYGPAALPELKKENLFKCYIIYTRGGVTTGNIT